MGNRRARRFGAALLAALGMVVVTASPGRADVHIFGVGVGTTGTASASPGWTDTIQMHSTRIDFDAIGTTFNAPAMVSPVTAWDCRHDEATEGDRLPSEREGFVLTSLEGVGETAAAGAGSLAGRCLGSSTTTSEAVMQISCPSFFLFNHYARVGSVVLTAGTCLYASAGEVWSGDFTMAIVLESTSEDNTAFAVRAAAFRLRA